MLTITAIADGKVCIGSYNNMVYCLDAFSGAFVNVNFEFIF